MVVLVPRTQRYQWRKLGKKKSRQNLYLQLQKMDMILVEMEQLPLNKSEM